MHLEILTPDAKVFEGEVKSVVFPGIVGGFEVLNGHAPLISALSDGIIKVTTNSNIEQFKVRSGFVEVLNNKLTVCVEGLLEE